MERYRDFAPTPFDNKGAFLSDRQDWFVVPVTRTRDSDLLAQSNFEAALKLLGGESDDVEVHRFGHWGPGWYEIILVRPGSDAEKKAQEIADSLESYPVLDDEDLSNREYEAACEYWENADLDDRIRLCKEAGVSIFAARREDPFSAGDRVAQRVLDTIVRE